MVGNLKGNVGATFSGILALATIAALLVGIFFFIDFLNWIFDKVGQFLMFASIMVMILDIVICLPLAFFHWSRVLSAIGFTISAFLFALTTWAVGFTVTYQYWGRLGVVIGVFLAGIGVVPLGLLAALLHGAWLEFFTLGGLALLTLLATGGSTLAQMMEQRFEDGRGAAKEAEF